MTAALDNTARIWDTSGKLLTELRGHRSEVYSASFSPDGQRIVTASADNTALIWDTSGHLLAELTGHQNFVQSASFSPDSQQIVTASLDGTVRVWQVENLDALLWRGCDWLHDYLTNNPKATESDKQLCAPIVGIKPR